MDLLLFRQSQPGKEKIDQLKSFLTIAHKVTMNVTSQIENCVLDKEILNCNSIGTLLMHIAAIELTHQQIAFNNEFSSEDQLVIQRGFPDKKNFMKPIGLTIDFYQYHLTRIRKNTILSLNKRTDKWLMTERVYGVNLADNCFLMYHVLEEELKHRGQIIWLKKRIKENTPT